MIESHEVASIFPMMGDEEYNALVADIEANGLLEPIWAYQGKIIDGRNRYRACLEAGIDPEFREWNGQGSLVAFVVSLNLKRRHLTSSQRAMIGIEVEQRLAAEARHGGDRKSEEYKNQGGNISPLIGKAKDQAADIVGTNSHYITDAKRIVAQAPELKEPVLNGTLTIPQAKAIVDRDTHVMRVMGSSESPEWYTPQEIVQLSIELLGEIDLDPCSNSHEVPNVPARVLYTKEDDGLSRPWQGKVYLNPPYGGEIPQWIEKLIKSYEHGVTEAIALLPGRIDTIWFQPLYDFPMCNIRGRLQFENAFNSAPFPSVIVYLGNRIGEFVRVFGPRGPIMRRIG